MKETLLIFCFMMHLLSVFPQDKILLMNGKELSVRITDREGANVFYEIKNRSGKTKLRSAYKPDIFSIIQNPKEEELFYFFDPDLGNEYTIDEMRHYIFGEQDAINHFQSKTTFWAGLGLGAGGAYLVKGDFISFLFPVAYTVGTNIPLIKIKPEYISNIDYKRYDTYKFGFEDNARSKKRLGAFFGSMIGVVIGSLTYELTN